MRHALAVSRPGPPPGIVDVWRVPLRASALPAARLRAALSPGELAVAARMRVGAESWALAHGALRLILAHYVGTPPERLQFERTALGKPRLAGGAYPQFNLSRREALALVAVASDREVGVDLEHQDEGVEFDRIAQEFLSPLDSAVIQAAGPTRRSAAFYAAWTRHEARRKLGGLALEDHAAAPGPGVSVIVRAVPVEHGYAAAIAASGGAWQVRLREASEAL